MMIFFKLNEIISLPIRGYPGVAIFCAPSAKAVQSKIASNMHRKDKHR
jgi:hypothetical protein